MNISSVSSASNAYLPMHTNNEINMLEKQKEQLEKQVQTTKESDMDAKTKQETIKLLQEQIQQIETQIQQKRNEKLTEGISKDLKDNNSQSQSDSTETGDGSLSGMSDLLQANASISKARVMNSTKESLIGKGNILEQEIKLDESRGVDPKAKKAELADAKSRAQSLDKDMSAELQDSKEKVKDASEARDDSKIEAVGNSKEENKAAGEESGTVQSGAVNKDEQNNVPVNNDPQEKDPLTWFLENSEKYKKVDTSA